MQASKFWLRSVEAVVYRGKTVISADHSIIMAMMQQALTNGRSATFYVSPAQAQAVMPLYWAPGRIKEMQQGRREDRRDFVAVELKNTAVLRINLAQDAFWSRAVSGGLWSASGISAREVRRKTLKTRSKRRRTRLVRRAMHQQQ